MAKFQKGNPGGPGRPARQTEADYLAATMAACPLDVWGEIVEATVNAAKAGDAAARSWLARYLIGDPATKAPAPTTVIVQQIKGDDPAMRQAVNHLASELDDDMERLFGNPALKEKARLMLEGK